MKIAPTKPLSTDEALHAVMTAAILDHHGALPFETFMQLALYDPTWGYYSGKQPKFGESGDFMTAPEISPLFSQSLARYCHALFETLPSKHILEFGAGTGEMADVILTTLDNLNTLPEQYTILDVSPTLKKRQQEKLARWGTRVSWVDTLPDHFTGVILANEVLDAMPVLRFQINETLQKQMIVNTAEGLRTTWQPIDNASEKATVSALSQRYALPPGYESECLISLNDWLKETLGALKQGVLLLLDYGFPGHEFYHPQRAEGTLMCHHQHQAHPDPLKHLGKQDITAHVDFTAVAECAHAIGATVAGYTHQAGFLLDCGIAALAEAEMNNEKSSLIISAQLKKLTLPHEMGELFKVMALTKGIEHPAIGFQSFDHRRKLSL